MTAQRVLVTGASGFVGRHVVHALLARGFEVHAVIRRPVPDAPAAVVPHSADLLDPASAAALIMDVQPSHLLHLAWTVTPGQFWRTPENLDWVAASLLLYRAFVRAGGRRVLVTGTCAEYDWSHDTMDEATTPCRPATLYGAAKDGLHRILAATARQDGVSLAWSRLFFLYGPYEAPTRLVPDVTLSLLRGQPAQCGDGAALRDFMAVEDVAGALATVLDSSHVGPINIASGRCVPIRDVILTVADLLGRRDLVRLGTLPPALGNPAKLAAVTTTLHTLGFRSTRTLEDGLAETVAWWHAQQ